MADSIPVPETTTAAEPSPAPQQPESDGRPAQTDPSSAGVPQLPNPNPSAPQPQVGQGVNPPPPTVQPSFRPAGPPVHAPSSAAAPQFSPVAFQAPGVPPPGVVASAPAVGSGPLPQVPAPSVHHVIGPPFPVPGQPMRFAPPSMPNGFPAMHQVLPPGAMPPPVYS